MSAEQHPKRAVITGVGVVTAQGVGIRALLEGLRTGRSAIGRMGPKDPLPGLPAALLEVDLPEALTSIPDLPEPLRRRIHRLTRRSSKSLQCSALAAAEAWTSGGLHDAALGRAGDSLPDGWPTALIIGGHNLSPASALATYERYRERPDNITPRYALEFLDSDHIGALSELFELRGEGWLVGGASATGNVALHHALRHVRAGLGPALAVGGMMELSSQELRAFRSSGALSAPPEDHPPELACRPFDQERSGFVYGQGAAALLIESEASALRRGATIWGELAGSALVLDARRGPEPSPKAQLRAMREGLRSAGAEASELDYINAHATASERGDESEASALRELLGEGGGRALINSSKSLLGHTLTAAGAVEAVATLLQMRAGFVHPNLNLETPLREDLRWAPREATERPIELAMSTSFGFGGINTAVILRRSAESARDAIWPNEEKTS